MTRSLPLGLVLASAIAAGTVSGCTRDPNVLKMRDLERGNQYAAEKKYGEAVIEYSRALQRDPNFSEAYDRMARVHLEEGNRDRAVTAFQRAANLAPDNLNLQIEAGAISLMARRFDDARRLADRVLEKDPRNVKALVLRGNALVGLEDIDRAIQLVEEAVRMAPGESDLYSNLGSLQASTGDFAEAERTYLKAIEIAPRNVDSYLPIGNFYWATGRPAQAERMFLKALEYEPNNTQAHRALATFYLGSGRASKAEASFKFVAERSPDVAHRIALGDYYLLMGRAAEGLAVLSEAAKNPKGAANARTRIVAATYASGQREAARKAVDELINSFPNHAPAVLLKARFVLDLGQHDEALRLALQASGLQEGFIEALYLVGQLYARDGDIFQATEAYRKILAANPFARPAQIELSRMLYARGEVESSNELITTVLDRTPNDLKTRVSLIRALLERRDLRKAETLLKEVNALHPRSSTVHGLMGALNALKHDYPAARRSYEAALSGDPNLIDATSGLIGIDLQERKAPAAVTRAEAAASRAPNSLPHSLLLAQTYGAVGEFDKAEATLRGVIDRYDMGFEAYAMLGQLLYTRGRLAEGRAEFERILERRPRSIGARTMVAIILRREGRTDEAVEQYRKVLEIDREAPVAANNLAWIYAEQGVHLDEAVILAKIARKQLPNVVDVADTLGWVYYRNGHPNLLKLAVPMLKETVEKSPNNALFRYHLGAAYARSGQTVEARRELELAIKLDPEFRGAAESRKILASLR